MLMFSYEHEESTCTFTLHVGEEKKRSIYSICFIHSARESTCVHFSIRFPKKVERKSQVMDALSCLVSGRETNIISSHLPKGVKLRPSVQLIPKRYKKKHRHDVNQL